MNIDIINGQWCPEVQSHWSLSGISSLWTTGLWPMFWMGWPPTATLVRGGLVPWPATSYHGAPPARFLDMPVGALFWTPFERIFAKERSHLTLTRCRDEALLRYPVQTGYVAEVAVTYSQLWWLSPAGEINTIEQFVYTQSYESISSG